MKRGSPEADRYNALLIACRRELERGAERRAGLHLVCDLLHQELSHYNWIGFYLAEPVDRVLVLGPFAGQPTDRLRIPYGRGVCGEVAVREDELPERRGFRARSAAVQSEIAVPVMVSESARPADGARSADGAAPPLRSLVAVIDVDSYRLAAFSREDEDFLVKLAEAAAPFVPRIPRP